MIACQVPVPVHLAVIAAIVATGTPTAARHFLPETAGATTEPAAPIRRRSRSAGWREPRTVLVGLIAAAFAVAEGAGSNWISISVIGSHRVSATVGSLAYGAFLVALTTGRWGVITSIGYGGFLGGPPLIGFVGHHTSVGRALLIVAALLGTSVPLASAAGRPLTDAAGPTRSASETPQGDLPCPTPSR